ncbi:DUF4160 domain-containing protein [Shimia aestuarii]|uniref:DUF4160 domain-containing protein n=1 Tax=Shimia aestuarii TaxID=254406 RepID=UPI003D75C3C7
MTQTILEVPEKIVAKLRSSLEGSVTRQLVIENVVCLQRGFKFEIFANEHPPPHFHVSNSGASARFDLTTGAPLSGRNDRKVVKHVRRHFPAMQNDLIEFWNNSRPSDCTVGKVKLAKSIQTKN